MFVYLDIPDSEVVKRALGRMVCSKCSTNVSVYLNPNIKVCPECGGELIKRSDDTEEIVLKRIEEYYGDAKPAIDYLKENNLLIEVSGVGQIEEIFKNIIKQIENHD